MKELQERITRARLYPIVTPSEWDRDCRCCMSTPQLVSRRAVKGVQAVIVFEGEEVHAWHGDDDLIEMHIVGKERQGYTREEMGFK